MARRTIVGVVAGALIMLLAATAMAATGDLGVLGLSSSGSVGGAAGADDTSDDGPPPLTTAPGSCLTWQRDDAADVAEVDCARPHLFESVGPVTAALPPGAPFPADAAWTRLVADQCTPLAAAAVGGKLDPAGRYRAGALKPTPAAWDAGDRTVRCGLQAPGRSGALFPSTGHVRDADQAAVFPAGTCLGLAGKEVSDPVDCANTHAAEVAGPVDLGAKFTGAMPSVEDQDNYLQPTCTKLAQDYVGGAQKLTDAKLTVYWTNLAQGSWDAGTRRVSCNLGALLPDNSGFAPLVGRAATGVTIGGAAAAATPPPPARPGAPAVLPGAATSATPAPGAAAGAATPVPGGSAPGAASATPAPGSPGANGAPGTTAPAAPAPAAPGN